jgi:aryl-alcohol dehydrogenase-like predicted oxidoreductase
MTRLFAKTEEADRRVADRVAQVAAARGVSRAQIALGWLLAKSVVQRPSSNEADDLVRHIGVWRTGEPFSCAPRT